MFKHKKLDSFELQADHLADICYYYAILTLLLGIIVNITRFLRKEFNQALNPDTKIVATINKTIASSLEQFVIFMCIYLYLLQNKGRMLLFILAGLSANSLVSMPFLFLVGRIFSFFEQFLTQLVKNKYTFSYIGFTLTFFPCSVMIGQIFGYSLLKLF